jgi:hypothetical protein
LTPLSNRDLVLDATMQPICRVIALVDNSGLLCIPPIENPLAARKLRRFRKHEASLYKIIFSCRVGSVFAQIGRLFGGVVLPEVLRTRYFIRSTNQC